MSDITDLFSAERAKLAALEQVSARAPSEWLAKASKITRALAANRPDGFTSDDVWAVLDACGYGHPPEPRALGAVFRSLAVSGMIRKTGEYRDSSKTSNHARPVAVWRACGPRAKMVQCRHE